MNTVSGLLLPYAQRKLIGNLHEDRFERIMTQARPFPGWYYGVRRATEEEDRHGIDFIAELDVMEVSLQVKSSVAAREQHFEHQHRHCKRDGYNIFAVIVCPGLSDEIVKIQALQILDFVRDRFYGNGGRFERETRR